MFIVFILIMVDYCVIWRGVFWLLGEQIEGFKVRCGFELWWQFMLSFVWIIIYFIIIFKI